MTVRIATALAAAALATALAGCARFPEIDAAEARHEGPTEAPRIVPVEPILARADAPGATPEDAAALDARAAALRRKAAGLRARVF
ncbi:hypothetical protein [Rhodovulum euryhalinum]|uniref:Beta-barrel assembly complex subunit BamF n=1 Tax=Rhodovulum euryhalinum TaxID=35805 RepID=A0A4R2KK03_9RHOB|nr:hypothetical protein [Rhodovulum euryhalinum]TCO72862.1 hypothetical protein EV655_10391 [Rhodovulum euryhalinum]